MTDPQPQTLPPAPPQADAPESPPAAQSQIFQTLDRAERAPYSRKEYFLRFAWRFVYATLWRVPRAWRWRCAILRMFGAKVGRGSIVYASTRIFHPWLLEIGDHTTLARGVDVYNLGPIRIGSHTTISQGAVLCAGTHDHTLSHLPLRRPPINVGSGVWIAVQAFIGPGVTVGDNSVVAARAVVVKDVPPATIVGGNPAKVIGPREMNQSPAATGAPS
jgi:putative colanic acid biosynthesis acetyltransferase WcaF